MTQLQEICTLCKRPKKASEKGSLTGFLFETLYCQCSSAAAADKLGRSSVGLCPKCGLTLPEVERVGSFTSYLFQDIRCSCSKQDKELSSRSTPRLGLRTRYQVDPNSLSRSIDRRTAMKARRMLVSIDSIARFGLASGEVIGKNYQLDELIGEGGMGFVFKGKHVQLGRTCAIKILAPTVKSEASWNMFQNEAKIIAGLSHEGICQIYDFGVHKDELPFYVMDYLEGETLEQVLQKQGTLSVGAVIEIFIKLADLLAYANAKGVIHKDIKPANIMILKPTQSGIAVKLLDFGIAELTMTGDQIKEADIVGTAAYMSPERFFGGVLDQRLDIYSLGCAMFESLTGSLPFQSEVFEELKKQHALDSIPLMRTRTAVEFPLEVEAVIRKCLGKTPEDRYLSAAELSADLQAILNNEPLLFANEQLKRVQEDVIAASADHPPKYKNKALILTAIGVVLTGLLVCLTMITFFTEDRNKAANKPVDIDGPKSTVAWPDSGVPTKLADTLDKAVGAGGQLEDKSRPAWLVTFNHPKFGPCKSTMSDDRIKIWGKLNKETINVIQNQLLIVLDEANVTKQLIEENKLMYQGLKIRPDGKETVSGFNCTKYFFTTKNREKGFLWTTKDMKEVADLFAIGFAYCLQLPSGYGMPIRMVYLDNDMKPRKTAFEMTVVGKMSESFANLKIKLMERQELEDSFTDITKTKDGGTVTKQPDGSIETVWDNGSVRIDSPGGVGFIRKKDGTIEHWGPRVSDCYVRTLTVDGRKTSKYKDGTMLVENQDFSLTYKYPDGRVQTWRVAAVVENNRVQFDQIDLTWIVETVESNGSRSTDQVRTAPPYLDRQEATAVALRQRGRN